MAVAVILSLAPLLPTSQLHLFFFSVFQERKRAKCRVVILWIVCAPLWTFILCACVTICVLIFFFFFFASFPFSNLFCFFFCLSLQMLMYSAGSISQSSKHMVSIPLQGWPQALWSVSPPAFLLGKAALSSRWGHGVGGPRALPSQLWGAHTGKACLVSPARAADSWGAWRHTGYFLGTAGEVKIDLIQVLLSEV